MGIINAFKEGYNFWFSGDKRDKIFASIFWAYMLVLLFSLLFLIGIGIVGLALE